VCTLLLSLLSAVHPVAPYTHPANHRKQRAVWHPRSDSYPGCTWISTPCDLSGTPGRNLGSALLPTLRRNNTRLQHRHAPQREPSALRGASLCTRIPTRRRNQTACGSSAGVHQDWINLTLTLTLTQDKIDLTLTLTQTGSTSPNPNPNPDRNPDWIDLTHPSALPTMRSVRPSPSQSAASGTGCDPPYKLAPSSPTCGEKKEEKHPG
jgi:hypothetical protein